MCPSLLSSFLLKFLLQWSLNWLTSFHHEARFSTQPPLFNFHKSRSASINQKLSASKLSEMLTLLLENNKFWCRDFTSKVLTLSRVKLVTNPKRFNWDCSQVTLKFLFFSPLFEALRKKLLSHSLSLTPFLSLTPSHSLFLPPLSPATYF